MERFCNIYFNTHSPGAVTSVPALRAGSIQSAFNFKKKTRCILWFAFGLQVFKPQPFLGADLPQQLWISQVGKAGVRLGNAEKDFASGRDGQVK